MATRTKTGGRRERRLAWEGCLNARDLGGYRTTAGWETHWGAVIRGDSPERLTEAAQRALVGYGIRTVIDLRLPDDAARHPNPFAHPGWHGLRYCNVGFAGPLDTASPDFTTLFDQYRCIFYQCRPTIAAVLTTLVDAPRGGVFIHCTYGKDRTGLIAALLLELAGVPRTTVVEDYALTATYLGPLHDEFLTHGPGERTDREAELTRWLPRAEVMVAALSHLDSHYGGVEAYLRAAGLTPELFSRLRDRLLAAMP